MQSRHSPAFVIYCDNELNYAAKHGSMSDALFGLLVRSQLSNMRSELHRLPVPWEPANAELESVAKASCRKYPFLRKVQVKEEKTFSDVTDEETEKQFARIIKKQFTCK